MADVERLLGKPLYTRDKYQGNGYAGVVTGLAWTSVGGEILFIETSLSKGKGSKLTLTGNLGDVMKESAVLALEYIKAHADHLHIDARIFDLWNIHVEDGERLQRALNREKTKTERHNMTPKKKKKSAIS